MADDAPLLVPLSGGRDYAIHLEAGLLASRAGPLIAPFAARGGGRVVVVSQPRIHARWGETLTRALCATGLSVHAVSFPAGERFKTLGTMARLYDALYNLRIDRKTLLVALGGGVVGDVVGFLAATYLRGLDYVQIPTTLLAMVDSSVGGKTGVDFRDGKNLIGAFHQPRAVLIDTDTLATLPARERRAGMAEVLKYGVIAGDAALLAPSDLPLANVIRRSCAIKAGVVVRDEREESGARAVLNFGHTIGHALESATRYRRFRHGEAIAIGMVSAACIGEAHGVTPTNVRKRIAASVTRQGLPVALAPDVDDDALIRLLTLDKKAEQGHARFVLARALGNVALHDDVDEATVRTGLMLHRKEYGQAP